MTSTDHPIRFPINFVRNSVDFNYQMLTSQGAGDILREYIAEGRLPLSPDFKITTALWQPDASAKIFKVELNAKDAKAQRVPRTILMRVFAPLDAFVRTEAEVGILTYMNEKTALPVPKVYWFDSSTRNSRRLTWVLTSADPGVPLDALMNNDGARVIEWAAGRGNHPLTPEEKKFIRRQLENHREQLRQSEFEGVGSYFIDWYANEFFIAPLPRFTTSCNQIVPQDIDLFDESLSLDAQGDGEKRSRIMHGDLHAGQVMIDPCTLRITCYQGWSTAIIAPPAMLPGAPVLEEEI
ncbi:hypothetical protein F5X68DRAFT_194522 [Plectosphaerella plurivora]|uniref:Aminoglycoside phosphotransferase domain-containing protein n=1 Tax=Plectosphaerella plurivora TaxID=936078 RepID=A0A9P9A7W6_9PEZI|nr:hypothetical protein F5X68DRAFT_194522 [Plectosphaerella plurivora]